MAFTSYVITKKYTDLFKVPFYIEDVSGSSNTLSIKKTKDHYQIPSLTIEKSTDGITWESMGTTSDTAITATVPANGKLYLRCSANNWGNSSDIGQNRINCTGNFNVGGNIMSLLYGSNFTGQERTFPSGSTYTFYNLFYNLTTLKSAEKLLLPATTLVNFCYGCMFYGCTALTDAPELPATTLAQSCYSSMFLSCTSLTTAPELPATTLTQSCYSSMFYSCTALTDAPELHSTALQRYCYQNMFNGCRSLTTAPELSATTLKESCYESMFSNCISLTTAPELPATTLATYCYRWMFSGCSSLTTAPVLPVKTLVQGCYSSIFSNCSALNSITCLATNISASSCLSYWVDNVSSSGTFTKAASMSSWPTGADGIPSGWTVQDYSA